MKHLLVTNDFPPKIGGIQSLLWEWWRRLPPESFAVLTTPYKGAEQFDAQQPFVIRRTKEPWLLPHPFMVRRINKMVKEVGADIVVLDPAIPVGIVGPDLDVPYDVILHGAEVTVPGRLPITRYLLSRTLRHARHVIAAGGYPAREAERAAKISLPITVVPPGVDTERFQPMSLEQKTQARTHFGIAHDAEVVLCVSRLVPRKGFDTVIRAAAQMSAKRPHLRVIIASSGRDEKRLQKLAAKLRAPVTFLGRVAHEDLAKLYGCADVFAMMCRNRWGGLEQEGFGIVFLEAAACGVPQIAGDSGGAAEAVQDQETGVVLRDPNNATALARTVDQLLSDPERLAAMGAASRQRAVEEFNYDRLARRLADALGVVQR